MTLKDMLCQTVEKRGNGVALRYKMDGIWQTVSYNDLLQRVKQVSELLAGEGVQPGDRVGMFLENVPEWPEIYFGIISMGAIAVPCDAKLREQEVAHVLRDSEVEILITSARQYLILKEAAEHVPSLHKVFMIDSRSASPEDNRKITYYNYEQALMDMEEAVELDTCAFNRMSPSEDDIASIIYTSGTTGRQKGAMLTHANFVINATDALELIDVMTTDNFLLVLPLHHSFAFTANLLVPIAGGSEISLVQNLRTVAENIREVSPTVLIGVPLLFEKMYRKTMAGLQENKVGNFLYKSGFKKVVGRGVHKRMGGKLRLLVTGGGPCDPEVLKGFNALGLPAREGYGLTETSPILTLNTLQKNSIGTVGLPFPSVEITIMDPDEVGVGEIAAKGPTIMKGYYNNPKATTETFRDDWFLTGDLGFIDKKGFVTITGRKKSLIVNREGKNIYPEEVESVINRSPFVLESLVLGIHIGEEVGERVGLVVVPNQEAIDAEAEAKGKKMTDTDVEELIRAEVRRMGETISDYKRPRRISIRYEEFEKTSTQKIKRYLYSFEGTDLNGG